MLLLTVLLTVLLLAGLTVSEADCGQVRQDAGRVREAAGKGEEDNGVSSTGQKLTGQGDRGQTDHLATASSDQLSC